MDGPGTVRVGVWGHFDMGEYRNVYLRMVWGLLE